MLYQKVLKLYIVIEQRKKIITQEEIEDCNNSDCPSLTDFASIVNEQEENCFCINEDVENLLNTYPRFAELENAIYGSKWVTISLEGCEYYFVIRA